jgi:hypothetical protein
MLYSVHCIDSGNRFKAPGMSAKKQSMVRLVLFIIIFVLMKTSVVDADP